jgi:hypothetical protein
LDCPPGKEHELAKSFRETFKPSAEIKASKVQRPVAAHFHDPMPVREAWIRDFFRVRNDHAHGRREGRYPSVSSRAEHLLLGAFAFPLLVKSLLSQGGHYTLTDDDQLHTDALEHLARPLPAKTQAFLDSHGITQTELGEALRMTGASVSRKLSGTRNWKLVEVQYLALAREDDSRGRAPRSRRQSVPGGTAPAGLTRGG